MAPMTYYYVFSIVMLLGTSLVFLNLLLIRIKGTTTFGQKFQLKTEEYKKVVAFAKNKYIINAAILELIFVGNLINSIRLLLRLGTADANFVLIFLPLFCIVLFIVGIVAALNRVKGRGSI